MSIRSIDLQVKLNASQISRRRFFSAILGASLILGACGCSTTKSQKKKKNEEFAEEDEDDAPKKRDQDSDMSDYVAKMGRGSKEKKKVSRGDTFLLSDKARQVYENTER